MTGYLDTCNDCDMMARIEPVPPRVEPVVYIRAKQPVGRDPAEKVAKFYREMNQRAREIRVEGKQ